MPAQEGPLVLADISGYTRFITSTELEHSQDIVSELLDTVVASLSEDLEMAQLEGDAVFFVGQSTTPKLIDDLEISFVAFHRRLRDILALTTCPCAACVKAPELTLKLIAHHGTYSRQRVGTVTQVHGADVIVPHRLAKNTIPSREYLLLCPPVLERVGERAADFSWHDEQVVDFGSMRVAYKDLTALRKKAYAYERERVAPDEARVHRTATFDAPATSLWRLITDPSERQRWMGVPRLDYRPGARGTLLGGEYHCHHGTGADDVISFRVVGVAEPRELTVYSKFMGREAYMTYRLTPLGRGTQLDILVGWDAPGGLGETDEMLTGMFAQGAEQGLLAIGQLLQEPARS